MKSFDQFRLAVLDDVSATVKKRSATPPMHFLIENSQGQLEPTGPIWRNEAEKRNAPSVMRGWIRKQQPGQLAVVGESFSVQWPTEAERSIRPSENPRRRHLVSVWFFVRGHGKSEVWDADVLKDADGQIYLGEWRALDPKHTPSGELFDPVFEAMNHKANSMRRFFG